VGDLNLGTVHGAQSPFAVHECGTNPRVSGRTGPELPANGGGSRLQGTHRIPAFAFEERDSRKGAPESRCGGLRLVHQCELKRYPNFRVILYYEMYVCHFWHY
jgi:hypothetical protein